MTTSTRSSFIAVSRFDRMRTYWPRRVDRGRVAALPSLKTAQADPATVQNPPVPNIRSARISARARGTRPVIGQPVPLIEDSPRSLPSGRTSQVENVLSCDGGRWDAAGMTLRGDWSLDELRDGLDGSPYSVPHAGDQAASRMLKEMRAVTVEAMTALESLQSGYQSRLRARSRVSEVHESNRVEGLGPEYLAETFDILNSKQADEISTAINRYALIRAMDADQRTMDVLGLHGAKLFADQLLALPDPNLTESDVRSMHGLLMGRDLCGGRYKEWINQIAGSQHVPIPPTDTPDAMRSLISWMNHLSVEDCLPAPVAAAAVHAWLAHIHPFDDGNGRVSRLLANLIVGRAGLPPLVVQLVGDRNRYIKALQISDEGGDLAPLVGVFLRIMKRAVRDMRNPDFALRLFEDEIRHRVEDLYTQWCTSFTNWLTELGGALTLHDLQLHTDPNEMINQAAFQRIRKFHSRGEALVVGGIGNENRYPDCRVYLLVEPSRDLFRYAHGEPSVSFLIYGPVSWSTTVYQRMDSSVTEVLVRPDPSSGVVVRERSGRAQQLPGASAADLVADALSNDFRLGRARARY